MYTFLETNIHNNLTNTQKMICEEQGFKEIGN